MNLVHLTSSSFFGGPERQMLGLAESLPKSVRTAFVSFSEGGRCQAFLSEVRSQGFEAIAMTSDFPRVFATLRELSGVLHDRCGSKFPTCSSENGKLETCRHGSTILLCHGYKANILGRIAAKRIGIHAVAVSRGWTGENRKVRAYEWLDRRHLRFMDYVVCVSEGQAEKVRRRCGVPEKRIGVIRNSARLNAFAQRDPDARRRLLGFFPARVAVSRIVLAAGRLSPEKGFGVLVEAAASILRDDSEAGIVLFGEGVLRPELERRIAELGLADRFAMPGFRSDLDSLISAANVVVLPSFTEGLPNVALEASAAGVPVVATAVGGTPEAIADGETGFLVPPGQPEMIAEKVIALLRDESLRKQLGKASRARMRELFTFEAQAEAYMELFDCLLNENRAPLRVAAKRVVATHD